MKFYKMIIFTVKHPNLIGNAYIQITENTLTKLTMDNENAKYLIQLVDSHRGIKLLIKLPESDLSDSEDYIESIKIGHITD